MMDNNSIKKNIMTARKRFRLTQQQMADRLGISRNSYRELESGNTSIINRLIPHIAELVGITEEELILGYTPHNGKTLDEVHSEYRMKVRKKEIEYEKKIEAMEKTIASLEERILLLEDLVKTKNEINMLLIRKENNIP